MQENAHPAPLFALAGLTITNILLAGLFTGSDIVHAQSDDPASVFQAFNAAVNAHDVDAALAFFADDAVVQFPNQPPPNIHRGASAIRAWLQADAAQHIAIRTEQVQVEGDRLTCVGKVDIDALRPLGITLEGPAEAIVQGGKITSFTFTLSQDTLAKLQAATQQPQSLPQTGRTDLGLSSLLILAALVVCGLGAVLRHQSTRR
jgi:ketosteroid isomerase-like protein